MEPGRTLQQNPSASRELRDAVRILGAEARRIFSNAFRNSASVHKERATHSAAPVAGWAVLGGREQKSRWGDRPADLISSSRMGFCPFRTIMPGCTRRLIRSQASKRRKQ